MYLCIERKTNKQLNYKLKKIKTMATKNAKVENVNKVIALNVCVNDLMSVATEAKNGKM